MVKYFLHISTQTKFWSFCHFFKLRSGLDGVPRSIFIAHNATVVINDGS